MTWALANTHQVQALTTVLNLEPEAFSRKALNPKVIPWSKHLYSTQLHRFNKSYHYVGPAAFGQPTCRLVVAGTQYWAGISLQHIPGDDYAGKMNYLTSSKWPPSSYFVLRIAFDCAVACPSS